jgi:hypothetical protein
VGQIRQVEKTREKCHRFVGVMLVETLHHVSGAEQIWYSDELRRWCLRKKYLQKAPVRAKHKF